MPTILVMGADHSAASLIEYLMKEAAFNNWFITVAAITPVSSPVITNPPSHLQTVILHPDNEKERRRLIAGADIVISLLPAVQQKPVVIDCLQFNKHLLTPAGIDETLAGVQTAIKQQQLLFLCEMGLNSGIDHMHAMRHIHRIKAHGGTITSFRSHCGGLISPESDDNPWHYKMTGAHHNIVLAGKDGGVYKEKGTVHQLPYEQLFDPKRVIDIPGLGQLAWYPNRDSLHYMSLYGLPDAHTFVRATLRYPEFCFGWKNIVELKLTDANKRYHTDGLTLQQFFHEHFARHGFGDWIEKQLTARFAQSKQLLEKLQQLLEAEQEVNSVERKTLQDFMMVNNEGQLMDVNLDSIKTQAAATVAGQMHEANLSMKQLFFLGMDDDETLINKGNCSAAEVLQFAMEQKLFLQPADKDLVVLQHEIGYEMEGEQRRACSSLVVKGENHVKTAMAKTTGLPLGMAAKQILQGKIHETGLHIPVISSVYEPVLQELQRNGISFEENDRTIQ